MDDRKICFILCCNDEEYQRECEHYIRRMSKPEGFEIEIRPIWGASSMASGYQQAMRQSDAKYKVYLHQDVFLLHRRLLQDMTRIFAGDPRVGILGVVGSKRLPDNGCMWSNRMRVGALRSRVLSVTDDFFDIPVTPRRRYTPVQALDGLILMTQYDVAWREDLFTGWDFYDVSQCMEFARAGWRAAVVYQEEPWALHDNGFLHLGEYHHYRKVFLQEYYPERGQQIAECDGMLKRQQERILQREAKAAPVRESALKLAKSQKYREALSLLQEHLEANQEDEKYCILCLLMQAYGEEGMHRLFSYQEQHAFSPEWLYGHFRRILHCLWREKYQFSEELRTEAGEYLERTGVTGRTAEYFKGDFL